MNHRGDFTLNEFIGIVLAVFGLILIGFLLFKLYGLTQNSETENVKKTLELLEAKVDALENNEVTEITLQGFKGASSWYITSYEKGELDRCYFDNCLCICPDVKDRYDGETEIYKRFVDVSDLDCQNAGFCKKFADANIEVVSSSIFDNKADITNYGNPGEENEVIEGEFQKNQEYIPIASNLMKIKISKDDKGNAELYFDTGVK